MLHKASRTTTIIDQGPFVVHANAPGTLIPGHADHGYGPLALIADSFLAPGTWIRAHEHVQEEIISWVPGGVMRHDDPVSGRLVVDPDHLMIMNAGRSFWHEERTLDDDEPLRMLQIFVRPHSIDLEPRIQHGPLAAARPGEWRHLFGPEGRDFPFFVRNDVHGYDARLDAAAATTLPTKPDWGTYFYVFSGAVEVGGERFEEGESGLAIGRPDLRVRAFAPSVVIAFVVNPAATVTRRGTVGDVAVSAFLEAAQR